MAEPTVREKKSETIEVRLSFSEKRAFVEACRERGLTLSEALRALMQQHAGSRRADRNLLFSNWEFTMPCLTGLAFVAVLAVSGLQPSSQSDAGLIADSFEGMDYNSDGVIARSEFYVFVGLGPDGALNEESREFLVARAAHFEGFPESAEEREVLLDEELSTLRAQVDDEFDAYDANGDGEISPGEFAEQVRAMY